MLTRWVEAALVGWYNRARHQRVRLLLAELQGPADSSDALPIGHVLPWTPATPAAGAFAARPVPLHPTSQPVCLPLSARRRHLYAIGATGSGKTNFLLRLIESDLARRQSLCVIDLRGDLVDRVLLRIAAREDAAALGRKLLLLDLRQSESVVGFNPLLGEGDAYGRAFHVLSVLKANADSWGVQLEETLRNALLALAEGGWSLLELDALLSDAAFRARVLQSVTDPYVHAFFASYDSLSADRQLQWRLPVLNKVSPFLAIPPVRRMLAERTPCYSLSGLLDKEPGAIILVALAVDKLHAAAHLLGGLFISAFQNAIMARADRPEASRIPVHLYVDEFENLVSDRFEAILAEGRRFGLGLTLSHQNLSQMPENLRQMILNNAQTQVYFQTGGVDAAELAREVVPHPGETREQIRMAMTAQKVGEAYLVRRGEKTATERVKILPCPDPNVKEDALAALREAALATYGRPAAVLDQEIRARVQLGVTGEGALQEQSRVPEQARAVPSGGDGATAAPSPPPAPVPGAAKPRYEVRHGKAPGRYAPGNAVSKAMASPTAPSPAEPEKGNGSGE